MNSVAMNLVANMMNTTFTEVNHVNRSGQNTDASNFKEVIKKTRNVSNNESKSAHTNENQQTKRFKRPKERVEFSSNNNEMKTQEKLPNEKVSTKDEVNVTDDVVDEVLVSLEAIENMDMLSEEIIQAIAEILNVSVNDVQATLEKLDMDVEALFDVNQLMKFVTEQLGLESSTEVLMTEGAVEKFKELATLLNEFSTQYNVIKEKLNEEIPMNQSKEESITSSNSEIISPTAQGHEQTSMNFTKEESSENTNLNDLDKSVLIPKSEEKNISPSGFETTLNQVVTEKVETFVMNGEIKTIHTQITAKDVFDQIVTGLKVEVTQGKQNIMLQLQPENLGKIAINISKENGIITGQFVAESEAVKSMIEKNIPALKQQLEAQGIDLRDIKITVGDSKAFFAGKDSERESEQFKQAMNQNKKRNMRIDRIQERINEEVDKDIHIDQADSMNLEMSSIEFQA